MIYAAIDIGSNAGRLLIGNVVDTNGTSAVKKISLTRVPLRLGEDVFTVKKIPASKIKMLVKTLKAYKLLMEVYNIKIYRACATSAMREAANREQVIAIVKRETGIKLEIISGQEEANLLFSIFDIQKLEKNKSYLYIDVGGGSTEISLLENGKMVKSKSFKLGTLRILKGKVNPDKWLKLKEWVTTLNPQHKEIIAVGTGGNINRILKMNGGNGKDQVHFNDIKRTKALLETYSLEDRIAKLGLRPDRADVIIPAADIYLAVMKYAGVSKIIVPKVGLTDGMIYSLSKKRRK